MNALLRLGARHSPREVLCLAIRCDALCGQAPSDVATVWLRLLQNEPINVADGLPGAADNHA
jgi:hypothetical protein